ncbi:MAG: hypothetical protein ACRD98_00605 [Nitrososphaera sp.]
MNRRRPLEYWPLPDEAGYRVAKLKNIESQCGACGEIFGGTRGFDEHRKNLKCVDPASAGLRKDKWGIWVHQTGDYFRHREAKTDVMGW